MKVCKKTLNVIHNADNVSALRQFCESVEILCHGLNECGVDANDQDLIFHLVFRKLPETLRLEFSKKVGGMECLTLKILLSLLRDHVNIATSVGYFKEPLSNDTLQEEQCFYTRNRRTSYQYNSYPRAQSFNQNGSSHSKPNSPCRFCNRPNHWNEECREYPTRETRLNKLGTCCLKCLKSNHTTERCFKKTMVSSLQYRELPQQSHLSKEICY